MFEISAAIVPFDVVKIIIVKLRGIIATRLIRPLVADKLLIIQPN